MALQILTCVWGKSHIELFKKTALESLSWDKNKKALTDAQAIWNIITDDVDAMKELTKHLPEPIYPIINIRSMEDHRDYIDQVQSASIWQMERSVESKDKVLLAPPDTIFGDGTVANLLEAGKDNESVVVVPHARVLPSILTEMDSFYLPVDNAPLVSLAWRHLHDAWVHAERGHANQSSYVGGVEWWRVGNIIQGTHRLPSPYLIQFTKEDLLYFRSAISFGHFDHMWPGDILIPRGRQRYLGSSDAAFIVEITEADKNVPPIIEGQPESGFWRDHLHNRSNGQIIFTLRGS